MDTSTPVAVDRRVMVLLATYSKRIALNITARRKGKGLSQDDLAFLVGSTQPRISMMESGVGNPQVGTLIRIALALDCTVEDLLVMSKTYGV